MPNKGAGDRQHIGKKVVLCVELAMFITTPFPARPGLAKKVLRRAWQIALKVLRRIHRVDRVFDGTRFGVEPVPGLVPNSDRKQRVERNGLPLHQGMNLLLFFLHHREQRNFFLARVIPRHAIMLLFFLVDFFANGQRINVDANRVIQKPQVGEALDDSGIGRARPARKYNQRVVMAVEKEPEIALAVSLTVPAVLLNREFRYKTVAWFEIKTLRERWI